MRFAVIDLGTNTFNLLIGELTPNKQNFTKLFQTKYAVKLGENGINLGYIAETPFNRGMSALVNFRKHLDEYNITNVFAFATSAIRSANNGNEFVAEALLKSNILINIIDGDEEAELIYYGNRLAVTMTDDISLIMDIGGGSTEFILANKQTIFWKQSFLLGAARLLEKFNFKDPLSPSDEVIFNTYVINELQPLFNAVKQYKPTELIGSSGAFDSVIDLITYQLRGEHMVETKTEYHIDFSNYQFISKLIKKSTLAERKTLKGLIEMRVDMIVISMLLIDIIVKEFELQKIRVSTYSLKEGVINKMLLG